MKRYDLELTATGPVMEEREKGAFVPFSEISGLTEQLADATRQCGVMAGLLREARKYVTALGKPECEISKVQMVVAQIDAIIAGQVQAQHPDDVAVDNFAKAMKEKLAKARAKGRSGWDDPAACSVEHLADLLLDHIGKGNPGAFEDIANFAMMLHQRGADPALLVGKLPASAVTVTETIRTAPERIWLQVGDQGHYHSEPFPSDTSEVSWCADSVVACEVPYVRADLAGHVVSPPLSLLIQMTDILKMCRSALITAYEDIRDGTAKGVIQYRIKLATKGINMAEHAIDAAAQANSGRFITEGQELELITVLQSIVNGFSNDPAHDAAALLKRITGEVPWAGDSFQIQPSQGGEPCAIDPRLSSQA